MKYRSSKRLLLLISLLVFLVHSGFYCAFCSESENINWQMSSLDVIVYDLNVERKEMNLQFYFSFNANSDFETRVIYIPKTGPTHLYYKENGSEGWYSYIIDRRPTDFDVFSPNQFWYPFDSYILKIVVGFNATLETKKLIEELTNANFKIEKDVEKSIEPYWDIGNDTKLVEIIPEEYAEFLNGANKTVFQIRIELRRKFDHAIIPFLAFWLFPLIVSVIFPFSIWRSNKKEPFKISAPWIAASFTLAAILLSLFSWLQSQKPPPCITFSDVIIMVALMWVIALPLFGSILIRREKRGKKEIAVAYPIASEFDINRFSSDVENFKNLQDDDTRYKLLENIRNQATHLPLDRMPFKFRNIVIDFLHVLEGEMGNEKMRLLCLRCISAIYNRRDKTVNNKIKIIFSKKIEEIYDNLTLEEKRKALSLQQKLREHDFDFMKKILTDALKWKPIEFKNLYTSIEFNELTKERISTLRETLWKWRSEANQKGETERVTRIDKFLNLDAFR
jgi:hypothetical protein